MNELKRILLAEDSDRDIELTLAALEEDNLANRIDVARDGEEALDYLRCQGMFEGRATGDPVVVLLDLKMPKVDGLEVLREIRADPRLERVPVVVLTSSREESDVVESYELGTNAFVAKPVDSVQFAAAIRDLGLFWAVLNEPPPPK